MFILISAMNSFLKQPYLKPEVKKHQQNDLN